MMTQPDSVVGILAANHKILLGDLIHCSVVDLLQLVTIALMLLLVLRFCGHLLSTALLRLRSHKLGADHVLLLKTAQEIAAIMNVRQFKIRLLDKSGFAAMVVGSFRPTLYFSEPFLKELDRHELASLVAHEFGHINRRDNFKAWLIEIGYCLVPIMIIQLFAFLFVLSPLNSLITICGSIYALVLIRWVVIRQVNAGNELSCDECAVEATKDPLALASALVKAAKLVTRNSHAWVMKTHRFFQPGSCLESRVQRLLNYKPRPLRKIFYAVVNLTFQFLLIIGLVFLYRFHVLRSYEHVGIESLPHECGSWCDDLHNKK